MFPSLVRVVAALLCVVPNAACRQQSGPEEYLVIDQLRARTCVYDGNCVVHASRTHQMSLPHWEYQCRMKAALCTLRSGSLSPRVRNEIEVALNELASSVAVAPTTVRYRECLSGVLGARGTEIGFDVVRECES